jgi:hypothetical protein
MAGLQVLKCTFMLARSVLCRICTGIYLKYGPHSAPITLMDKIQTNEDMAAWRKCLQFN